MPEVRALEPRSPSFSFITLIHYNRHGTTDAEILSAFSPMGVCVWNRPATRRERTNDIHQILYLILSVLTHQSYTAHDSGVPASKIRNDRLVSRATRLATLQFRDAYLILWQSGSVPGWPRLPAAPCPTLRPTLYYYYITVILATPRGRK